MMQRSHLRVVKPTDHMQAAETAMRAGEWDQARSHISWGYEIGQISLSDRNLNLSLIEWRQECVREMQDIYSVDDVSLPTLRRKLLAAGFDEYVIDWVIFDFRTEV